MSSPYREPEAVEAVEPEPEEPLDDLQCAGLEEDAVFEEMREARCSPEVAASRSIAVALTRIARAFEAWAEAGFP